MESCKIQIALQNKVTDDLSKVKTNYFQTIQSFLPQNFWSETFFLIRGKLMFTYYYKYSQSYNIVSSNFFKELENLAKIQNSLMSN
jgi:hypothetical protein